MTSFHGNTFQLLGVNLSPSAQAQQEIETTERRLGFHLPPSVREWYSYGEALRILEENSNGDPLIPLWQFATIPWQSHRLLAFRNENQGVCQWALLLDGSDDPPVYLDFDTDGKVWQPAAPSFSAYVYSCVWDYQLVLKKSASVQAQNDPITPEALAALSVRFTRAPQTHAWPSPTQYRFFRKDQAILIWAGESQADWMISAADAGALEDALKTVWNLDSVGKSLYSTTEVGETVLKKFARWR
jgi:hypothetical protein